MKSILLSLSILACVHLNAHASPPPKCYPVFESTEYVSSQAQFGYSDNGFWLWWTCTSVKDNKSTRVIILTRADYGTFVSIAGKLTTAMKSPAQAASSWKRNVTLELTDPSLALLYKDYIIATTIPSGAMKLRQ